MITRRQGLMLLGGGALAGLAACSGATPGGSASVTSGGSPSSTGSAATGATQLMEAIKGAGVIVYFRHGATTWSGYDKLEWPREQQRLLSEEGIKQSETIGKAFTKHGLNAQRVISSPFERCKDMSTLAFGRYDSVEPKLLGEERPDSTLDYTYLTTLLGTPVPAGENLIVVAHSDAFRAVANTSLPEGGGAVVRPNGSGGFDVLGMLTPSDWTSLA